MSLGRTAWQLRRRVLSEERVVTGAHVKALARSEELGRRARMRVRGLHARELILGPPRRAQLQIAGSVVELGGGDDFPVDWKAFVEIFGDREYASTYGGGHVLDVGAHKGYFGAFTLACGASRVLSFEPAAGNYVALERAASRVEGRWRARRAALGSSSGTGVLHLDHTSWAHSLVAVERPVGEEVVAVVTLNEALAELPTGGTRTIVKIDAEGSECDILTGVEPLTRVDVLMVEWHAGVAPCSREELVQRVTSAGFSADPREGVLRFSRLP